MDHYEIVSARKYYGRWYVMGNVVLRNNVLLIHFTDNECRKDANAFVRQAKSNHERFLASTTLTI